MKREQDICISSKKAYLYLCKSIPLLMQKHTFTYAYHIKKLHCRAVFQGYKCLILLKRRRVYIRHTLLKRCAYDIYISFLKGSKYVLKAA